ncbi:AAA domain-containing protein [Natronorubrum sp. A-ect3]|uniref:AAA domain-containing protein n=1 Tax=Natronorubrum sp. A-ect3 TaxID=3242698 RepID=UPI00359DA372
MSSKDSKRPVLSPSGIGQFFNLQSCPMYLQWEYDDDANKLIDARAWEKERLSPVLSGEGNDFERQQLERLRTVERRLVGLDFESESEAVEYDEVWPTANDGTQAQDRLRETVREVSQSPTTAPEVIVHQAPLSGTIGAYPVRGYADFLRLVPTSDGLQATIYEVKSSSTQKVHHRYQAVIYAMLLEQLLKGEGITTGDDSELIDAAVVTPENGIEDGPEDVDEFDTTPYRVKLELKLQEGGSFDQTILETFVDSTRNRIARRCSGCEYEQLCVSRALENQGLELLGLQASTQEALEQLGFHDLEDFATLFEQPGEDAKQYDYEALKPVDEELVRTVRQEADISNLQKRAQIAYRFLSEIDDEYGRDGPDFYPNALQGSGNNLPEDDHGVVDVDWTDESGPDYPSESLVRVYLYVQQDFAQDRATLLSACVTNSMTGQSRQVTELPNALPTTAREKDAEEARLFGVFFDELAEAIQDVAPDLTTELDVELDLGSDDGFLHLYLYSDRQREALMNVIRRHPTADWRRPLRTLLGLRAGIDQNMISVLQDDFRQRWALRFPGLGLVQTVAQFQPWNGDWFDWQATRSDGSTAKLNEIFETDVFDSAVRYDNPDGSIRFDHEQREPAWTPDDERLARWVYPVRNRETDMIPVEYIWSVFDRLDPDETDDPEHARQYCYRSESEDEPITEEDLELFAQQFSRATHHIEQSIQVKDRYVPKEPIDLSELSQFSFAHRTLDEACVEYQQLEYHTIKTNLENYYCQPAEERIDSGSSVALECTAVDKDRNVIEGRLLDSSLEPHDSSDSGVIGSPLSVSDHDFMVLTKLTEGGDRPEDVYKGDPTNIAHSPTVIVSSVDETNGDVLMTLPFESGWPNGSDEYTTWHKGWGTDDDAREDDYTVHIEPGDKFIVDPMIDQLTQARAYEALEHAIDVPVRRWLRQIYQGDRETIPVSSWDRTAINEYVDRVAATDGFERPNNEQQALIEDVDHGIVTLQGPPGTGKTKYTVAPAILSRVHAAMEAGDGILGAVSAVSHSAVDEALESVVDLLEASPPGETGDELQLFRICSSATQGVTHSSVQNVYYNDAEDSTFRDIYNEYLGPETPDDARALFFGPPVSIRSFVNKLLRTVDDADYDTVSELMGDGESTLFDLAVVDEASMMDLPLCLLFGSFLDEDGQFMLVGDHRQMQPIQRHEWEDEDREPIEIHVPFLSALDFLRYLRGEDVDIEYFESDPPGLDDPQETLPVHRLRQTYRLPPESARMHTDLFYEQDDIELESAGPAPQLNVPKLSANGPMVDLLDSDDRVILLVHDEAQSQKSNPVEQALVTDILQPLSRDLSGSADDHSGDSLTAGVVVPFRAQRRDVVGSVPDSVQVDTVERFQGGERDLMVLSMTASDRGYISQLSEFLLEPNRFNVGASRMKRKLIVLASASLFEESNNDVDTFEKHQAWVSFYEAMGGLEGDYDEYLLNDLVTEATRTRYLGEEEPDRVRIRAYTGYDS